MAEANLSPERVKKNLSPERVKNVLSDIQKALECAICLEVVKKPFKLCSRGHLVCVACLKTIQTCPTCKGELLLENPVCIQSLLECLPRACRYSDDGCDEMIQDGDDHEKFCGFRLLKCRMCDSTQKVLVKNLHDHLNTVHPEEVMIKTFDVSQKISWPDYHSTKSYDGYLYVPLTEQTSCIILDNSNDKYLKVTFKSFTIGKPDGDYYAKITFEKNKIGYMYTIKALYVEDDDEEDSETDEEYCMKIPKNMLSNFIEEDGALQHNVVVFKL